MIDFNHGKLYTVKELAALNWLRISKTSIWRRIKAGELSHYRLGGQILISERHIEEYLRHCEVTRTRDSNFIEHNNLEIGLRK